MTRAAHDHALSFHWLVDVHQPQQHILQNALRKHNFSHAYLFYGQRNVGKSNIARLFIQSLLCNNHTRPCQTCTQCIQITRGTHPDIHVIKKEPDSAFITVDRIREMNRFIRTSKVTSTFKVGILYDAQFMNAAAANAFLKSLEEPPENVVLVLIAHTPLHLPRTIYSRCTCVKFNPMNKKELQSWAYQHNLTHAVAQRIYHIAHGKISLMDKIVEKTPDSYEATMQNIVNFLQLPLINQLQFSESFIREIRSMSCGYVDSEPVTMTEMLDYLETIIREMCIVKTQCQSLATLAHGEAVQGLADQRSLPCLLQSLESIHNVHTAGEIHTNIQLAFDNFFIHFNTI